MSINSYPHTMLVMLLGLFLILSVSTLSCSRPTNETETPMAMAPFKALASSADCADVNNRLFVIDNKMVFWDRRGSCADNSYDHILFGKTPENVLCKHHDSIAGPFKRCQNQRDQTLFETMIENLKSPNLGLGTDHQVKPVFVPARRN